MVRLTTACVAQTDLELNVLSVPKPQLQLVALKLFIYLEAVSCRQEWLQFCYVKLCGLEFIEIDLLLPPDIISADYICVPPCLTQRRLLKPRPENPHSVT